jgi:murein DD-endopeptidase MepM/ murein hydrolase activator NlpD
MTLPLRPTSLAGAAITGLLALVGPGTVPAAAAGPWGWPVPDPAPELLAEFARPAHAYAPGHRGLDLAVEPGSAVLAPADGVITLARRVAGTPVVVLAHGSRRGADELRSTFEAATATRPVGTLVRRGQVVARVEPWPEHCGTKACLHWGVRRGLDYLDPLTLLRGPVRLLPVGPPVPARPPSAPDALRPVEAPRPQASSWESPWADASGDPHRCRCRRRHGDRAATGAAAPLCTETP